MHGVFRSQIYILRYKNKNKKNKYIIENIFSCYVNVYFATPSSSGNISCSEIAYQSRPSANQYW